MTNYYETLKVAFNCKQSEITKAFRAQSLILHPDRGGDTAQFQSLQNAYETLSDVTKRRIHDASIAAQCINNNSNHYPSVSIFSELSIAINELLNYGICLSSYENSHHNSVINLAFELIHLLSNISSDPDLNPQVYNSWSMEFKEKLHSLDSQMCIHRQKWKVVVANILVACTGIGLILLAGNYLATGQTFFARTKREQLINDIDIKLDKSLDIMCDHQNNNLLLPPR